MIISSLAGKYQPVAGTLSEGSGGLGFSLPVPTIPKTGGAVEPNSTMASVNTEGSQFYGIELNLAMGLGVKFKIGATHNSQPAKPKLTEYEKIENTALKTQPKGTKLNPTQ